MSRKRRRWLVASIFLSLGLFWWLDPLTPRISPLPTPGCDRKDILFVRAEEEHGGTFLLMGLDYGELVNWEAGQPLPHVENAVVYRYRAGIDELEQIGIDQWEQAKGPICESLTHCLAATSRVRPRVSSNAYTLRFKGRTVGTTSRLALSVIESPDGSLAAALSASGPLFRGSMIPLLGPGQSVYGKRYHQIFHIDDGTQVGGRAILQGLSRYEVPSLMWTADGKYVVYFQFFFSPRVWIVPVIAKAQEEK